MAPSPEQQDSIALVYQNLKDYKNALIILNELTAGHPKNTNFLVSRGVCEYLAGSSDQAVVSLNEAIKLDSKFLPAYLSLGYIYEKEQRHREAIALYRLALSRSRDQPADPLRSEVATALQRVQSR